VVAGFSGGSRGFECVFAGGGDVTDGLKCAWEWKWEWEWGEDNSGLEIFDTAAVVQLDPANVSISKYGRLEGDKVSCAGLVNVFGGRAWEV